MVTNEREEVLVRAGDGSMARERVIQAGSDALRLLHLTRPAFRIWERAQALRAGRAPVVGPDGLPLPPKLAMMQTVGRVDALEFVRSGREAADLIAGMLERNGAALGKLGAILDFGCGCGRVLRHWAALDGPEVHGLDYNAELVAWVDANLPFVEVRQNDLQPPVPYTDERFDVIYALSVFTHLTRESQFRWIGELGRILRPGGHLLLTTQGDAYVRALERPDRRRHRDAYAAGELVVTDPEVEGTNRCSAYHPHNWVVSHLLNGFALEEFVPSAAEAVGRQDVYLARRT